MTRAVLLLICVLLSACSVTFFTEKPQLKRASHIGTAGKASSALRSADWVAKYKALERKFGYSIPQDAQIKSEGGQFRVPQEVIDHNLDMTKAQ
jgi:hypothetical protein